MVSATATAADEYCADAQHVYVAALTNQPAQHGATAEQIHHAPTRGFADDDLRHVVLPCDAQHGGHDVAVRRGDDFRAKFAGEGEILLQSGLIGRRQRLAGVHVDREPRRAEAVGELAGPARERLGQRAGADGSEQALAGFPCVGILARCQELAHLLARVFGGQAQGDFPERHQVAFAEEARHRGGGAVGQVNFSLGEPAQQIARRQIHEFKLGGVEDGIGHGFLNCRAGDLADEFGAALDVLDVERGENVEAGVEQLTHVLPALGMAAARGVRVGEFVHERELRTARENGVEIHLGERDAAILDGAARDEREVLRERVGFGAAMRLDIADGDGTPRLQLALRRFEHGVGLAHAGAHAEEDFESATLRSRGVALDRSQQRVGTGALGFAHGFSVVVLIQPS